VISYKDFEILAQFLSATMDSQIRHRYKLQTGFSKHKLLNSNIANEL